MTVLRLSHFCRNEIWRLGYSDSCSLCSDYHYKDNILHLNLTIEEIDERNEKRRKIKCMKEG